VLESHLGRHESLRKGRHLAVAPNTGTVFPSPPAESRNDGDGFYADLESVSDWVENLPPLEPSLEKAVQAALQRVTTIKPAKRRASVEKTSSRGALLKEIESGIEDAWVASQIATNVTEDELEPDDILVVLPDSYRAKSRAPGLIKALSRHNLEAHLVGVNSSVDEVFRPGSIAIAHIYRAKGNEAPMVYAVDAQRAAHGFNAVTRRNTLFTAITRSRAWVRVTGWGENMDAIEAEVRAVIANDFKLGFTIPTAAELMTLRHIHRDRPPEDEASVKRATEGLSAFLEALDQGEVDWLDLPPNLRTRLQRLRGESSIDDS